MRQNPAGKQRVRIATLLAINQKCAAIVKFAKTVRMVAEVDKGFILFKTSIKLLIKTKL